MCIIAVKKKGTDFVPAETIERCMQRNPDGFSMAWNKDGAVLTFRSMDPKETMAEYTRLATSLDPKTTGLIFHARIATHGSKKAENCHCWLEEGIVFRSKGKECRASLAFAHNGILRDVPARDDLTDSETFLRDWFLPVLKNSGWETAMALAKAVIGTSKFAFITNNGNIATLGNYISETFPGLKGAAQFSNSSYLDPAAQFCGGHQASGLLRGARPSGRPSAAPATLPFGGRGTVLYNDGVHGLRPADLTLDL